jgi:hypothetical protein
MKKTLITCQLLLLTGFTFAQRVAEEQFSFQQRLTDPIKMEVSKTDAAVDFVAINQSAFPYEVEVEFQSMTNLQSYGNIYKSYVTPGRNRLFSLKIINPGQAHNYSYTTKYHISIQNKDVDPEYPYLIPLSKGKRVKFFMSGHEVLPGDTIFAMRKGIVTAIPGGQPSDRLMQGSLEVYHSDGTIGIYPNLDPESVFVSFREKIFPGQPIGIVRSNFIRPTVLKFIDGGRFQSIPHLYALSSDKTISVRAQTEVVVDHPENIVVRELSKGELKKFKKGTLFEVEALK